MTYRKTTYSPQALKVAPAAKPEVKPAGQFSNSPDPKGTQQMSAPIPKKPSLPSTPSSSRQEIDVYLKNLTQLVEKDPKKAAEVFKSWLDKPSKIVKPKRAA